MKRRGINSALGITDAFHYRRVKLVEENMEVKSDTAPVECLAASFVRGDLPYLAERDTSNDMIAIQIKEQAGILELSLDPTGEYTIETKKILLGLNLIDQP